MGLRLDPVDQVLTLWITLPPTGPTKRASRVSLSVSAVALFGCQKTSWFCSWTLWTTTLTLRVMFQPSGSSPIDPQGQRVGQLSAVVPLRPQNANRLPQSATI